jgi:CheY-like chemotaxis protein
VDDEVLWSEVGGVGSRVRALAVCDKARHALLLTDHRMPGMTGAELIRRLRQRCPALPVAAGADEVLKKPFDLGRIQEAVEGALERKDGQP